MLLQAENAHHGRWSVEDRKSAALERGSLAIADPGTYQSILRRLEGIWEILIVSSWDRSR